MTGDCRVVTVKSAGGDRKTFFSCVIWIIRHVQRLPTYGKERHPNSVRELCGNDCTYTQLIRNFGWSHCVCVGHVVPYLTWAMTATVMPFRSSWNFGLYPKNKEKSALKYLICAKTHVHEETFIFDWRFRISIWLVREL